MDMVVMVTPMMIPSLSTDETVLPLHLIAVVMMTILVILVMITATSFHLNRGGATTPGTQGMSPTMMRT
jgi:hypothetical protein